MRVAGLVLCGGRSSRMGRAKAWLPFGHETMLQRVVRVVGAVVSPVVVVAAPGQALPPLPPHVHIVHDEREGLGPVQGLATGLSALVNLADAAFVASCDVPFLSAAFVQQVVTTYTNNGPPHASPLAVVPRVASQLHPMLAVYDIRVLAILQEQLATNTLRLQTLFDHIPTRFLDAGELPEVDSLRNLNTPEEYATAYNSLSPDNQRPTTDH